MECYEGHGCVVIFSKSKLRWVENAMSVDEGGNSGV